MRLLPRSLPGQIALLVAVALFVAQAINFGMLLRERRVARLYQTAGPSVARLIDANERMAQGGLDFSRSQRGVRLSPYAAIPPGLPRRPDIEEAVRRGLDEAGVPVGRIITGVRAVPHDGPFLQHMSARRAERLRRFGAELLIAAEVPGKGWLMLSSPWPRTEQALVLQLIAQTLILYVVVLIPLLWAGHRIARPLRSLAQATQGYRPGDRAAPVEARGPSDVRAVTAAFNALTLRVTAMIEEKDRMLGAIGHDLRTPLAALRVRIESVEDETDRARMADIIEDMNHTLEDILSLARLGRPSEPPIETDVSALIDAVVADFHDLGNEVTYEEAPRLILRLRSGLMRRAVRNLIENAVKYAGGAEVRLVPESDSVGIEVADRGPGIPGEQLGAVFDPFTRLEVSRNRETGGIGLGLALARAIVREAGGDIALANREGGGLLATIRLPRA